MDMKSKQLFFTMAPMKSFRGSSDYTGAHLSTSPQGWLTLSGPWSWTSAPGPCQELQSCVCLKTRLNPSQQLSQIRSLLREMAEALRGAGADCRADVAITESMEMFKVQKVRCWISRLGNMILQVQRGRDKTCVCNWYIDFVLMI